MQYRLTFGKSFSLTTKVPDRSHCRYKCTALRSRKPALRGHAPRCACSILASRCSSRRSSHPFANLTSSYWRDSWTRPFDCSRVLLGLWWSSHFWQRNYRLVAWWNRCPHQEPGRLCRRTSAGRVLRLRSRWSRSAYLGKWWGRQAWGWLRRARVVRVRAWLARVNQWIIDGYRWLNGHKPISYGYLDNYFSWRVATLIVPNGPEWGTREYEKREKMRGLRRFYIASGSGNLPALSLSRGSLTDREGIRDSCTTFMTRTSRSKEKRIWGL